MENHEGFWPSSSGLVYTCSMRNHGWRFLSRSLCVGMESFLSGAFLKFYRDSHLQRLEKRVRMAKALQPKTQFHVS